MALVRGFEEERNGGAGGGRVEDTAILVGSDEYEEQQEHIYQGYSAGRTLWRHCEEDEVEGDALGSPVEYTGKMLRDGAAR